MTIRDGKSSLRFIIVGELIDWLIIIVRSAQFGWAIVLLRLFLINLINYRKALVLIILVKRLRSLALIFFVHRVIQEEADYAFQTVLFKIEIEVILEVVQG